MNYDYQGNHSLKFPGFITWKSQLQYFFHREFYLKFIHIRPDSCYSHAEVKKKKRKKEIP